MKILIKNGNVLYGNELKTLDLMIDQSTISKINEKIDSKEKAYVIDASNLMVLPGFIDIHTHGAYGVDISTAPENDLEKLTNFYASQGVTSFLATLGTASKQETSNALKKVRKVKEKGIKGAKILGIHLEGPHLSKEFKGALPEEYIIPSSTQLFEEYNELSGNDIKLITVAPENKNVLDFITYVKKKGIVVSIGHSGAEYSQCMNCIEAGAGSSTHLFNGMKLLHQHRPSIIGACLESDIFCELICDGRHLHPGIVRLVLKTKGIDKIIAVTDSIMAAGLEDGKYKLGSSDIVVKDGDAQLADGSSRAGSTLTMIKALENITKFTNKDIKECINLLTYNPAKLLGITDSKGSIKEGKDADIVIIDSNYNVQYTIVEGRIAYCKK